MVKLSTSGTVEALSPSCKMVCNIILVEMLKKDIGMSASSPATVNMGLENSTCLDGESIPQVLGDLLMWIFVVGIPQRPRTFNCQCLTWVF